MRLRGRAWKRAQKSGQDRRLKTAQELARAVYFGTHKETNKCSTVPGRDDNPV